MVRPTRRLQRTAGFAVCTLKRHSVSRIYGNKKGENMAEGINLYVAKASASDETRANYRKLAVEAALEVIKAAALGGGLGSGLGYEFQNLSAYADLIQASLELPKS